MTNQNHERGIEAAAKELLAHGEFGSSEGANRQNVLVAARAAISAYLAALAPQAGDNAEEPVAWTTQAQLDGIKGTGNNGVMWGEPLPHHPDIPLYTKPVEARADKWVVERLTRPIIGIENRTGLEAFDIMADRIHAALASAQEGEG